MTIGALGGTPTVAIHANDFALLDFGEDDIPVLVSQPFPDVEVLVRQVVEFKNDRIALATVNTRVTFEEIH